METRANYLWVGAVTLVLSAALFAFIFWLARLGQGNQEEFDIFYKQSVSGLASGSQVSFAGVPVGQVTEIALAKDNPEFVRVRIQVKDDVPILVGTQANIQASFTGVSAILLDGARKDNPPITCATTACPEGRPVIPPGRGGFGEIVANAPLLLERVTTLTEQLNTLLGPENQAELAGILKNSNRLSGGLADATPELTENLREFRVTIQEFNRTLATIEKVAASSDALLNREGGALAEELRGTLKSANAALAALAVTLDDTRPAARQLRTSTLPKAEATLEDLRATSRALRAVTEKLESEGAGALLGGKSLPDYKP